MSHVATMVPVRPFPPLQWIAMMFSTVMVSSLTHLGLFKLSTLNEPCGHHGASTALSPFTMDCYDVFYCDGFITDPPWPVQTVHSQ